MPVIGKRAMKQYPSVTQNDGASGVMNSLITTDSGQRMLPRSGSLSFQPQSKVGLSVPMPQRSISRGDYRAITCLVNGKIAFKYDQFPGTYSIEISDINLTKTKTQTIDLDPDSLNIAIAEWLCYSFLQLNGVSIHDLKCFRYANSFSNIIIDPHIGDTMVKGDSCLTVTHPSPNDLSVHAVFHPLMCQTYTFCNSDGFNNESELLSTAVTHTVSTQTDPVEVVNDRPPAFTGNVNSTAVNVEATKGYTDLVISIFPWTVTLINAGYFFEIDSMYKCFLLDKMLRSVDLQIGLAIDTLLEHFGPFFLDGVVPRYLDYKALLSALEVQRKEHL